MRSIVLSSIHLYPLKSCAPHALDVADVEARGLVGDRRWLAVDDSGRFLTGRQHPRLTRVRAVPTADGGLRLDAPGMPALALAAPAVDAPRLTVTVWKSQVDAALVGADADAWLSECLAQPARLVYMDGSAQRMATTSRAPADTPVSFADALPLLLLSQAAVDALSQRVGRQMSALRFRPNLIIDGVDAHAEDAWRAIRIGDVEFDVIGACVRCVFTTVDPERGERDADGEPLRTLLGYRRGPDGVTFGQYLLPRAPGRVACGDEVTVLR